MYFNLTASEHSGRLSIIFAICQVQFMMFQ